MIDFVRMRVLIKQIPKCLFALERTRSRAEGTQSQVISDMPRGGSGSGDKMLGDIIDMDEMQSAYVEAVQELTQLRSELSPYINKLDNAKEKGIVRLRYMYGYSPDEIAKDEKINIPKTTVCRCLDIAERKIKKMESGTNWH